MTLEQAVWVDPCRMSGAPCFRGSRLPVRQLFDWLADGASLDEFINDFSIDRAAAEVVLRTAGVQVRRQRPQILAEDTHRLKEFVPRLESAGRAGTVQGWKVLDDGN